MTMTPKAATEELPNIDFFTATFYDSDNGARKVKRITVHLSKLTNLLMKLGFRRYDQDGEYFYIKVENNVVDEVDQILIIDQFEEFLRKLGDPVPGKYEIPLSNLIDKMYQGIATYFSLNLLNRMRTPEQIEFAEDGKEHAYFFYANGFVKVTKNEVELKPYEDLKGKKVWTNQILEREFKPVNSDSFLFSNWGRFVRYISNNYSEVIGAIESENPERFEALKSIIGYNLHKYFHGKLKATVITDSTISDSASGRSGKTLLMKGLGKMLNSSSTAKTYIEINGKNFDFHDRFRYQECRLATKLVHLNDVMNKFDFESLFNDISEGIKPQRKNQEPFLVNAKIVISSNRTIRIDGDSAEDRAVEFEMSNYFSARHSPSQEFQQWFFRDWNEEEWAQFDNFMIHCVQVYLKRGLVKPNAMNLNRRKLIEESCTEFVNWMDEFTTNIISGEEYVKLELKESFLKYYPDFTKLSTRKFTIWLKLYTKYSDDFQNFCDKHERRSNSKELIKFIRLIKDIKG